MNYTKPEITVLGSAELTIQGSVVKGQPDAGLATNDNIGDSELDD